MPNPDARAGSGAPASMSDQQLMACVCAGDTPLFEELMRRYNQRVYRVARAIVKNSSEAEAVMQQAYLNAFTHLRQFAERASCSTDNQVFKPAHDRFEDARPRGVPQVGNQPAAVC